MGACAGLCYNALWYFPVLIVIGGLSTLIWDTWLQQKVGKLKAKWRRRKSSDSAEPAVEEAQPVETVLPEGSVREGVEGVHRRTPATVSHDAISVQQTGPASTNTVAPLVRGNENESENENATDTVTHAISIKVGVSIIIAFFSKYIHHYLSPILTSRSISHNGSGPPQHPFSPRPGLRPLR